MSDAGNGSGKAAAEGVHDSQWPADINDWESWPEHIDLDYLVSVIGSLKAATLRNFIFSDRFYYGENSIISIAPPALLEQLVGDPRRWSSGKEERRCPKSLRTVRCPHGIE